MLDANGTGTIGDIIAALNWVAVNAKAYNIRVVNLSVGAAIRESYWTDPLTLAAKALTDQRHRRRRRGRQRRTECRRASCSMAASRRRATRRGCSPSAPRARMGTLTRADDTMARLQLVMGRRSSTSRRSPICVAPGTGTVSLAVPGSTFYKTKPHVAD